MRPKNIKTNESGFTLIELLVVISVIGVIASVALVNMGGMRQNAAIMKSKTFSASIQQKIGIDLLGDWDFEEGAGTVAKDASGNGNDGTITGAIYTTSVPAGTSTQKYALQFDGAGDYVSCGSQSSLSNLQKYTLTAWINMNDRKYIPTIANKGPETNNQHFWWGILNTNVIFLEVGDATGYAALNSSVMPWNLGQWYFVAVTLDNATKEVRHYRDGNYINLRTFAGRDFHAGSYPMYIGRYYGLSAVNYDFNGMIDGVRIYGDALTLAQIQKTYLAGLKKLLAGGQITENEYNERIRQLNKEYVVAGQKNK